MSRKVQSHRYLACIYVRLSQQGEQEESIDRQLQLCTQRAKERGWQYVIYREPPGARSGYYESRRPAWKQLLKDLKARDDIAAVIVADIARASRNLKLGVEFVNFLLEHDIEFVSLKEEIDLKTAAGRLTFNILSAANQWFRDDISERKKRGYRARDPNIYASNVHPYGLKRTGKYPNIKWETTPDFTTVVELFELYVSGRGAIYIAQELDRRGRTWINRKGQRTRISYHTVGKVIRAAERYRPFLNPTLLAQVVSTRNRKHTDRHTLTLHKHPSLLLRGLLYCSVCGRRYKTGTMVYPRRYGQYVYQFYTHTRLVCEKVKRCVHAKRIDKLLLDELKFLDNLSDDLKQTIVYRLTHPQEPRTTVDYRVKRQALLAKIEGLIEMRAAKDISLDEFRRHKSEAEQQLAELPDDQPPPAAPLSAETAWYLVNSLYRSVYVAATTDTEQGNLFLRTFIQRIEFDGTRIVQIQWHSLLNEILEGVH